MLRRALDLGTEISAVWGYSIQIAGDLGDFDLASRLVDTALSREIDGGWYWDFVDLAFERRDITLLLEASARALAFDEYRNARRRHIPRLLDASTRAHTVHEYRNHRTFALLGYADAASREGDHDFAEKLARAVVEEAGKQNDGAKRWMAVGVLGHVLERAQNVEDAVRLWTTAFEKGSDDVLTINRLLMYLEHRLRDYERACQIASEALSRNLRASAEEQIRKRFARCQAKLTGGKRRDVVAYSVRRGGDAVRELFHTRVKPSAKSIGLVKGKIAVTGKSRKGCSVTHLNSCTGEITWSIGDLPRFWYVHLSPEGSMLGESGTEDGGRSLSFLGSKGDLLKQTKVPDSTSGVVNSAGVWNIGCHDGKLYGFSEAGEALWEWVTPGSEPCSDIDSFHRPYPYNVVAASEFSVIASFGNLYAVDQNGSTLWHATLPQELVKYDYHGNNGGRACHYRTLGIPLNATLKQIRKAYGKRVKETHPDLNPDLPDAAEQFNKVMVAHKSIKGGQSNSADGGTKPFSSRRKNLPDPPPWFATVIVGGDRIAATSSTGSVHLFNKLGRVEETRIFGRWGRPLLSPTGHLVAVWHDWMLFFVDDEDVVRSVAYEHFSGMRAFGQSVIVWFANTIELFDNTGRRIWAAEFTGEIKDVLVVDDRFVVAAGVVAAFGLNAMVRRQGKRSMASETSGSIGRTAFESMEIR